MKLLVFSDLHGSLNSLNALINTDDFKKADKVISLGDITFGCSRPNDCINLLIKNNIICLLGNNDSYIAYNYIPKKDLHTFDNGKYQQMAYMVNNVSQENKKLIQKWQKELYLEVEGTTLYFVHYPWIDTGKDAIASPCPNNSNTKTIPSIFKNIKADYIFYGHEHSRYSIVTETTRYYCIDTIGLENPGHYIIIDTDNNEIKITDKYIEFDIEEEISLMNKVGYPYNKNKINSKK